MIISPRHARPNLPAPAIAPFLFVLLLTLCSGGLAAFLLPDRAEAQQKNAKPDLPPYLTAVSASVSPARTSVGGKATLLVTVEVAPGYHINASDPGDPNLIPTVLKPDAKMVAAKNAPVAFGKPRYPQPETLLASYAQTPINVYGGKAVISLPVTVTKQARAGTMTVAASLRVQGCNDSTCFPPVTIPVSAPLIVNGVK